MLLVFEFRGLLCELQIHYVQTLAVKPLMHLVFEVARLNTEKGVLSRWAARCCPPCQPPSWPWHTGTVGVLSPPVRLFSARPLLARGSLAALPRSCPKQGLFGATLSQCLRTCACPSPTATATLCILCTLQWH